MMTEQEQALLHMIRTHDDPAVALKIAMETIISFLEQPESCQAQALVGVQESA